MKKMLYIFLLLATASASAMAAYSPGRPTNATTLEGYAASYFTPAATTAALDAAKASKDELRVSTGALTAIATDYMIPLETFPSGTALLNWKLDVDGFAVVGDSAAVDGTQAGQRVVIYSTASFTDTSVEAKLNIMKNWEAVGVCARGRESVVANEWLAYHLCVQSDDAGTGPWKVYRVFLGTAAPRVGELTANITAAELNDFNYSTGVVARLEVYDTAGGVRLDGYVDDVLVITYLDAERRYTSGAAGFGADAYAIGRVSNISIKRPLYAPAWR